MKIPKSQQAYNNTTLNVLRKRYNKVELFPCGGKRRPAFFTIRPFKTDEHLCIFVMDTGIDICDSVGSETFKTSDVFSIDIKSTTVKEIIKNIDKAIKQYKKEKTDFVNECRAALEGMSDADFLNSEMLGEDWIKEMTK